MFSLVGNSATRYCGADRQRCPRIEYMSLRQAPSPLATHRIRTGRANKYPRSAESYIQ